MKRILILVSITFTVFTFTFAQKIKFDDGKVFYNKKAFLSYKKASKLKDKFFFYDLKTGNELLFIEFSNNATLNNMEDDYTKIFFTENKIAVNTNKLDYGYNCKPAFETIIKEKVIDSTGTINDENLKKFTEKYNNVTPK